MTTNPRAGEARLWMKSGKTNSGAIWHLLAAGTESDLAAIRRQQIDDGLDESRLILLAPSKHECGLYYGPDTCWPCKFEDTEVVSTETKFTIDRRPLPPLKTKRDPFRFRR